jgi:hypothetical protein
MFSLFKKTAFPSFEKCTSAQPTASLHSSQGKTFLRVVMNQVLISSGSGNNKKKNKKKLIR